MNIKNIDILNKIEVMEKMKEKKLPYLLGRAISKNLFRFKEELELINRERIKICEKYAEKDTEGNPVIKENRYILKDKTTCSQELDKLFNTEVEVNIDTISVDAVLKCDEKEFDSLTVEESGAIEFMIE